MSLSRMKERMNISGINFRQETLRDSIFYEALENENDLSYCDTFYRVLNHEDYYNEDNYEKIHPRLYSRKWASFKNHEMTIKTLKSEPIHYGELFWDKQSNTYWICVEVDCKDDVNYTGILLECNYLIFWQRESGEIVSRYCTIVNASSYSNGESGNKILFLQSNQFMAYMPYDGVTAELDVNKRISISHGKCRPYTVTRFDDISFNFGEYGILNIIFTQDSYNEKTDVLVECDSYGHKTWICDYVTIVEENPIVPPTSNTLIPKIIYTGDNVLNIGGSFKTLKAKFYDKDGNEKKEQAKWEIITDEEIEKEINSKISDSALKIKINDTDSISGGIIRVVMSNLSGSISTYEDFTILMV